MFAYCLNNPVNNVDSGGELPVASQLLEQWLKRTGENVYFGSDSRIAKKLQKSKKMRGKIAEAISAYESDGTSYFEDSVCFDKSEPDLWLGIRNGNYTLSISEETREVSFLWYHYTQTRYVVQITLFDTYDFNRLEEGDGIGSTLNNIGFLMQELKIGASYYWEVSYEYTTRWT